MPAPNRFEKVTLVCKANIYFDGRVVSHTIFMPDGRKKTVGVMFPGTYTFNTAEPERMEITAGACRARHAGGDWTAYGEGASFDVPGGASFDIAVDDGIAQYICTFG